MPLAQDTSNLQVPPVPPGLQARMADALGQVPELRDRVGEIVAVRDAAVAHLAAACPPGIDLYAWDRVYGESPARTLWCELDSIVDAITMTSIGDGR